MVETLILLLVLFGLIFLGVPICFVFSITSVVGVFLVSGNPMLLIPQGIFGGMNSFTLLAIPFFILAGELMNEGGITERLVKFSGLIVGRMKASLAQVNIVASMFFGGITGSAVADTSAIGGMLIPAMVEEGYDADFSVAVTASSSIIGPIIPPSIVMVLYGTTVNTSVGALFMAGLVPGILVGLGLMLLIALMARKWDFPRRTERYTFEEAKEITIGAVLPLGMPLIILGGILSGIFTPTEAGAISTLYSLVVALGLTHGEIVKMIPQLILRAAKSTATIMLIIGNATVLSRVFATLQVQQSLGAWVTDNISGKLVFLLFVNILLLFMGMFMEGSATVILLAPILAPIAASLGVHPVHFGIIMCINVVIGNATPPVGVCLFVGSSIGKVPLYQSAKAIMPFVAAEVLVLLLVTYIPAVCLTLPRWAGLIF